MSDDRTVGGVLGRTQVIAAGLDRARDLITSDDDFIRNQSPFDRQARMRLPLAVQKVTLQDYLTFLRTQVRPWSDEEIDGLGTMFASIAKKFEGLAFDLPETVYLVKTSGQEEGFSAYTRRNDVIVMSETKVALMRRGGGDALHPAPDSKQLEDIYIHECFHLFSKNNPKIRRQLYGAIHYRQCESEVALPDVPWQGRPMPSMKLTNPDTPFLNVAIDLIPPGSEEATPFMPVLLARKPYESGLFFDDMDWVFLAIDESSGPDWRVRLDDEGQPTILQSGDETVKTQYERKVGRNIRHEIFHPDEILAQNFVLVIDQPILTLLTSISEMVHRGA